MSQKKDKTKNDLISLMDFPVKCLKNYGVENNPLIGLRGCRIGVMYPEIYTSQIKTIFETAKFCDSKKALEIVVPFTINAKELEIVRKLIEVMKNDLHNIPYILGAMIQTPVAALNIVEIISKVDFVVFDTNALTTLCLAWDKDGSSSNELISKYWKEGIFDFDPFVKIDKEGVGELMKIAINKIRSIKESFIIKVCGDHTSDPDSVSFFHEIGVDNIISNNASS